MSTEPLTDERPLAFVYDPNSFSALAVAGAARGVCKLVWVIDRDLGETMKILPLLKRLGTIVDVTGLELEEAAAAIAETSPAGILTLKDSLMEWTARLAVALGLPFHSVELAERFADKHTQRLALAAGGVPVPSFAIVPGHRSGPEWERFCEQASYPAVLKPCHNSEGSRDTVRVDSPAELRRAVSADAELCGALSIDTSRRGLVLESYLQDREHGVRAGFGDYVSVESIVSGGQVSHVAVTGRMPPAWPFRESGFFIAAELSDSDRVAALECATAAVRALDVRTGALHTEVKFTPDGPRVIEVNGRIGGGVPEMLLDATGVELLPIALRLALGEQIEFSEPLATERVAYLLYVQAPAELRVLESVEGLDELGRDPDVTEIIRNRRDGAELDWRDGNHGHVFSVRGTVEDHDTLLALVARVGEMVRINGRGAEQPEDSVRSEDVTLGDSSSDEGTLAA